jgi:hypothetical protein
MDFCEQEFPFFESRRYYDMQSGVMLHETGHYIRLLLQEAGEVEQKIQAAQKQADTDEVDEDSALTMMELQIRREELKTEVEILENPLMRWVTTIFLHFRKILNFPPVIMNKLQSRIIAV